MTVLDEIVDVDQEDTEADDDMELLEETSVDDDHLNAKETVNHNKEWITDSTLPFGWSYKGQGRFLFIKAPNGKHYQSRRLAFADMLNSGKYSAKDIIFMRNALVHEGWKNDERIPKGWMLKKRKKGYIFLGQGGEFFKSTMKAIKFVGKYRKYFTDEDLHKIKSFSSHFYSQKSGQSVKLKENMNNLDSWIFNGDGIPAGWGMKYVTFGKNTLLKLLSPEGQVFQGRRTVLKHMIDKKYSEEEIEEMRSSLKYDGWLSSPRLPEKWFYRKSKTHSMSFVSESGQYYRSRESVRAGKDLGMDDILKIQSFNAQDIHDEKDYDTFSLDDPSVPKGWRIKRFKFGNSECSKLLSPEGRMFQGRRVALKFMIDQKYPKKKIEEMRALLRHDGWLSDSKLPEKWFYKKSKSHIGFLNASGLYFKNRESVMASKDILQDDKMIIVNFQRDTKGVHQVKTKDIDNWTFNDTSVPRGWGIRKALFGKVTLWKVLSPEGTVFQGRRAAMKYMIDQKYSDRKIEEMRSYLQYDGWLKDSKLPEKWFYKRSNDRNHQISFLSANGDYFKSKEKAKKSFPALKL